MNHLQINVMRGIVITLKKLAYICFLLVQYNYKTNTKSHTNI